MKDDSARAPGLHSGDPIPGFDASYDRHMTAATIVLTEFFMDYLRSLYRAFDGDVTAALVLGEVGQTNVRRFIHEHHWDHIPTREIDSHPPGLADTARGCSALSAALASGVPRETARRKLKELEAKGWIARDASGEYVATEAVRLHFAPEFNREICRALLNTAARLQDVMSD
jgi:hypothetical protein